MKKRLRLRLFPLVLALAVCLTGCSDLLDRSYSVVSTHVEYPVAADKSLEANNYQELVSAILYLVGEHAPSGSVRLYNYSGDVESDAEAACTEVVEQDPLGAFAVSSIRHTFNRIVSYYEVSVSIQYSRTQGEVSSIVSVTGTAAVQKALSKALAEFSSSCILRLNYYTGDTADLDALARMTYFNTPAAAFGLPEFQISVYPDSGSQRIVDFEITWPETTTALRSRQTKLLSTAQTLLDELDTPSPSALLDTLHASCQFSPDNTGSAYDALVTGTAGSQGMALAYQLLCTLSNIDATVVEGTLMGVPRWWVILSTDQGYRHLDPVAQNYALYTDDQFTSQGYVWETGRYPACTEYAP